MKHNMTNITFDATIPESISAIEVIIEAMGSLGDDRREKAEEYLLNAIGALSTRIQMARADDQPAMTFSERVAEAVRRNRGIA